MLFGGFIVTLLWHSSVLLNANELQGRDIMVDILQTEF